MISSFRDETKICMVLEFCPDRTIGDLLKTYDDKVCSLSRNSLCNISYVPYLDFILFIQCLPEKRAVTLFAELLGALSYLHSIGILKRDFKNC